MTRQVQLDSVVLPVPLKVVSSQRFIECTVLVCKSIGNVALLVLANYTEGSKVTICIVDMHKSPRLENWLETEKFPSPKSIVDDLRAKSAVVKELAVYANKWTEVAPIALDMDSG